MDLWLLSDLSSSTGGAIEASMAERTKLLEKHKKSIGDELREIHFAAESVEIGPETGDAKLADDDRALTRTALAIRTALARTSEDENSSPRPSRLLLVTDGFSTEPLAGLAPSLIAAKVPVDFIVVPPPTATDIRVERVITPSRVQPGEPFLVETEIHGNLDEEVPVTLYRDGIEVATTKAALRNGSAKLQFTDRLADGRAHLYEAIVSPNPERDAYAGNNSGQSYVEVDGGNRILVLTKYTPDPTATALRRIGLEVDERNTFDDLDAQELTGVRVVIINNVPAWEIPSPFLSALEFFVESQGGGLMMAGGRQSFASGGYSSSSIDELLPVSMELRTEHRKLAVAMAIAMDRSGSMSAAVAGGTKMDLANSGAANALKNLGGLDAMTVFAVDSTAHKVVPLQPALQNRARIEKAIRKIQSQGGGIFVYEALDAAWKELRGAPQAQKHIILFSDAADSEEPGDYKKLITKIRSVGGTVSVIALGSKKDPDAALLEDIAKRGDGRIFYVDNAVDLPNVFSQETIAVARSAFVRERVPTRATGSWREIAPSTPEWLDHVDGYNLSYLRPWARQALASADEYNAPLIAFGPRGTGRTAAVSMPLGAEFSDATLQWPDYENFLQTLSRWLIGSGVPRGIALRPRVDGSVLTVDLLYDDALWSQKFALTPPELVLSLGADQPVQRAVTWERIEPGKFTAKIELAQGELVRGSVTLGSDSLPFGPLVASTGAEWRFDPTRIDELRQLSIATGGAERLDLSEAWQRPYENPARPLQAMLIVFALVLILLDALLTRIGGNQLSKGRGEKRTSRRKPAKGSSTASAQAPASKPKKDKDSNDDEPPQGSRQASRFARAKRGR